MRFRLDNGSVVVLQDSLIDLCQLFTQIHEQTNVFTVLEDTLKQSQYKKIKTEFIELLKQVLDDQPSEDQIRQLGNPESSISQAFKAKASSSESSDQILGCLEYVQVDIDRLLSPLVHRLRFLKDPIFLLVLEYLQIPSTHRSNSMFETLPFVYQGCKVVDTDFKTLVDPSLHPYIDFIEKLDDETFLDMTRASLQLGIPSLTHLIGCRMAKLINTCNEQDIRQRFGVPDDKFIDATKEKLDTILKQKAWLGSVPFTSAAAPATTPTVMTT